ncbi:putative bifunctional UDP-sugar hydrolase/5'-nucleotidase periplasmic, partial [delta proteobacterium NaphS2]
PFGLLLNIILIFITGCSVSPQHAAPQNAAPYHLTVLFTNDTHGHPVKFSNHSIPDMGGLPARATLVKKIRKTHENVLLLDAGDINTGHSVSNFFKAKPDILGYNYIGYDAMVLGNHEFDNPMDVLREQMDLADFPFLSANVKDQSGELVTVPYIIKRFSGFNVGIFGITTTGTRTSADPDHVKDLIFEDEVAVAKKLVSRLRKEVDVIIALTHLGIYAQNSRGSKRLAAEVPGIDLIVDGETHTKITAPLIVIDPESNRQTLIVQAWQWGLVLGKIDLSIQDKRIVDYNMEIIPINLKRSIKTPDGRKKIEFVGEPIMEDPALLALLQPYADKVHRFLSGKIGYAQGPFLNDDGRYRETALGDLVTDAMRWHLRRFKPDFALTNSGAIRAGISEGPVTRETIYNILPFESSLVFVNLTGSQVQALFDFIGTTQPGEGAFPQVSRGVRFTLNLKKGTCEDILINDAPIDPDKSYGVVTNSYLSKGGDGYDVFPEIMDRFDSSTFQRDALVAYIEHLKGNLVPKVHQRIKILP